MVETAENRLRRLHMRSIRRGIKEMDLILSDFSARHLASLDASELDLYERFLEENDHDLYQWVSGQGDAPEGYAPLMRRIKTDLPGVTGHEGV